MKMDPRLKERYEIAFGLRPRSELKSWEARYQGRSAGGSWYKAVGGKAQLGSATKAHTPAPSLLPEPFGTKYVTDYSIASTKSYGEVQLRSSGGGHLTAGGATVEHIRAAGASRYGSALVELETSDGRHYVVEKAALKG
jgi:hypothetical protein